MASTRITFTLDQELAEQARKLQINTSAAAREGVEAAVGRALAEADRTAYLRHPERPDDFWDKAQAQAWGEGETGDAAMQAPAPQNSSNRPSMARQAR